MVRTVGGNIKPKIGKSPRQHYAAGIRSVAGRNSSSHSTYGHKRPRSHDFMDKLYQRIQHIRNHPAYEKAMTESTDYLDLTKEGVDPVENIEQKMDTRLAQLPFAIQHRKRELRVGKFALKHLKAYGKEKQAMKRMDKELKIAEQRHKAAELVAAMKAKFAARRTHR